MLACNERQIAGVVLQVGGQLATPVQAPPVTSAPSQMSEARAPTLNGDGQADNCHLPDVDSYWATAGRAAGRAAECRLAHISAMEKRQVVSCPLLTSGADMHDDPRRVRRTLAAAATLLLAMASATAAEVVVGTRSLEFVDTGRQRPVVTELWFEAAPGTAPGSFTALPPLKAMPLVTNASPAAGGGRKPLIVISHGNWATRYAYAWLAVEFVKAGYLVLSPSHPGTMFGDLRPELRARLWERSLDVSFALDQLLADPVWRDQVDMQRIGFVGHSFGGWTGVSLAGGVYRYDRQLQACNEQVQKDQYCAGLIKDYNPGTPVADGARSFKDPRFKAFYLMASGVAAGFDEASLKAIDRPILLDTARGDPVLDPAIGSALLAKLIPGASETVRNVGHFSYAPQCKPLIGRLLAGQVCVDPPGVDRADVHARARQTLFASSRARFEPGTGRGRCGRMRVGVVAW